MAHKQQLVINSISFPLKGESTLLETMESLGIQSEYQCRDGHCGACQCKLEAGEVEYTKDPLAYIRPGHILPCVCKAKSSVSLSITGARLPLKMTG